MVPTQEHAAAAPSRSIPELALIDEDTPLIRASNVVQDGLGPQNSSDEPDPPTRAQLWNLYISHFLSMWNSRGYEFGAVLFTASAYPSTLAASSIRGMIVTVSMLFLSPSIGRWIDYSPSRLRTLRLSIFYQRLAIIISCVAWYYLVGNQFAKSETLFKDGDAKQFTLTKDDDGTLDDCKALKVLVIAIAMALGVAERIGAVANRLSMERDWVSRT